MSLRPPTGGADRVPESYSVRRGKVAVRVVVALLSATVVATTGYAWSAYDRLDGGIATSDVLSDDRAADGATDILLVGIDSRTDAHGDPLPQAELNALDAGPDTGTVNTDTLILVRIPASTSAPVTAISIPRDSYVDIPGHGTHKINSAYARAVATAHDQLVATGLTGPALATQEAQAGRKELIRTVEQLTGASVDHYAELNLVGFADMTQAVGGVQVCLNAPAHDTYSGVDLPAGAQTVEGPQALAFVRQRHGLPRGDLDRIVRQQAFLASLTHQVLSAGTLADPSKLTALIDALDRYIVIDPGWDLLSFASGMQGRAGGDIGFRTIPTGSLALRTPADGDAVQVDPAAVRAFVAGVSAPSTSSASTTNPLADAGATVEVENGTSRIGLGAAVTRALALSGTTVGPAGTTVATTRSIVKAGPGTETVAAQVASDLGGLPHVDDDALPAGHIEVVLGRDYTGPTGATTPPPAPTSAPAPPLTADGVPCVN
ncbi:MAG: LytR family transcriptional regulator [Pseudonocardiaceae bacterium]|nr:MAG: LytR family transcriptional regulator [Pseudonocardiaceae bacterium]